ncbi:uncharacterized protein BYT42DRAFT_563136 [Radiomyces spectabilis]|uniref:uncharacterized protein n=1 Tax=Radiomyces spectabilis TaxID=64574 RepID=UPI00221ED92A|nr:uncharacterized protein BYT42DRAFT_563136 [Radiomyces spectabilis]KAI8384630.1 hypothetical protein BYT42DRAFT_563136 [Radiomyces spectabilis]
MNTALYKKRKRLLRCHHILTMGQIRDLGQLVGRASLRQAVEEFTNPANFFRMKKPNLAKVHQYLLDHHLTSEKLPSSRIQQGAHARLLINIIFPGYTIARAREQACREERENTRISKSKIILAYDKLPTSDIFERLEELARIPVNWNGDNAQVTIPSKKLSAFIASAQPNVRLHLFLWLSDRTFLTPNCTSLIINGKETWNKTDERTIKDGYKHIDLTKKMTWSDCPEALTLDFCFQDDTPNVKYVSVCTVWQYTPSELVSQLYLHTATKFISRAITASKDTDATQKTAVDILKQCPPKDFSRIPPTEQVFLESGAQFSRGNQGQRYPNAESEEEDLVMGDETISLLDPIMLSRIQHPARGIFCNHAACFDACFFFQCQLNIRVWQCPQCFIYIKGMQELYIDYPMKQALLTYPNEERLMLRNGAYVPETVSDLTISTAEYKSDQLAPKPAVVITVDDEDPDEPTVDDYESLPPSKRVKSA